MKYLLIQNQGLIDPFDLSYMGGSTKRGDSSKIGFFGSGNKYALATLITNKVPFRIFSGLDEIIVKTKPIIRRNQQFDAIYLEFKGTTLDTSLTAQMGPQWEPWFAVREVYCNAMDEGGVQVVPAIENIEPSAGTTRIYIGINQHIEHVVSQWNKYFSKDRIDIHEEIPGLKLLFKYDKGLRIYRKGVLVHEDLEIESLFDYDIEEAEINENRTLSNVYSVKWNIERIIAKNASSTILKRILLGMHISVLEKKRIFEYDMEFHLYMKHNIANWAAAAKGFTLINETVSGIYVNEAQDDNALLLPGSVIRGIVGDVTEEVVTYGVERSGMKFPYRPYEPNEEDAIAVSNAVTFLRNAGYIDKDYDIEIVRFDNPKVYAATDGVKIRVGKNAIEQGRRFVAMVMLEELFHIESHLHDETRAFQNFILSKALTEIEKRTGQFL